MEKKSVQIKKNQFIYLFLIDSVLQVFFVLFQLFLSSPSQHTGRQPHVLRDWLG